MPFQGVLRVSSTALISVLGLRGRYNERGDFLITTTPPSNEAAARPTAGLYFPHIVDWEGYTTQFVLFSNQAGQSSSGTLRFFSQSGGAWNATVQESDPQDLRVTGSHHQSARPTSGLSMR